MPARRKEPVVRRDDQIIPLTDVVTCLDSVRAYRRRSSLGLDEKFQRLGSMGYPDLGKLWWQIEDDVKKIVEMPLKIRGVAGMIRLNFALKLAGRLFFILLVIVIAARFVRAWRSVLWDVFGNNLWFLILVVVGSIGAMNGEVITDYLIRRRVVRYERETEAKYAGQVASLKKAAQTVIDRLAREVKHAGKDPASFPFHLFFDDYDGIEVVGAKIPRSLLVFKRKFKIYSAIVKPH